MAFGENRDARNAAIGREMMHMDMQQRRTACVDGLAEGRLDEGGIVEVAGTPKVEQQVTASEFDAVSLDKIIMLDGGL